MDLVTRADQIRVGDVFIHPSSREPRTVIGVERRTPKIVSLIYVIPGTHKETAHTVWGDQAIEIIEENQP